MTKVEVDRSKCVSLGVCETISEVFELDEDSELVIHEELVPQRSIEELREAVASCPVKALRLVEAGGPDDSGKEQM